MSFQPIPLDATQVVYFPYGGRAPHVVQVERHTPTQVHTPGRKFRRKDGFEIGTAYSKGRIGVVDDAARSWIEAAQLKQKLNELECAIRAAASKKLNLEFQHALGRDGSGWEVERNAEHARAAIVRLEQLLERYAGKAFG